jgi:hypothetical protein
MMNLSLHPGVEMALSGPKGGDQGNRDWIINCKNLRIHISYELAT